MNYKHILWTVGIVFIAAFIVNRFVPSIGAMIFSPAAPAKSA
jgi:hypothetical protein